jgi:SOS response regulatory protein OraA/RecX
MAEVYLTEEDEERLKRNALDKIFLALLKDYAETSKDPAQCVQNLRSTALEIAQQSQHSEKELVNQYAQNFVASIINEYLDQLKFKKVG